MIDRLSGLIIRVASAIVLLAVVAMPVQMFTVAWPLFSTPDIAAISPPGDELDIARSITRVPAWVPLSGLLTTWSEFNNQRQWITVLPSGRVHGVRMKARSFNSALDDMPGSPSASWSVKDLELPPTIVAPDFLMIDPSGRWLIALRKDGRYGITDLNEGVGSLVEGTVVAFDFAVATPGSRTLLLASGRRLRQLQLLRSAIDNQPMLALMREWNASASITHMAPAPTGQRVLVATIEPSWALWHSTSNRQLAGESLAHQTSAIGWTSSEQFFVTAGDNSLYWEQQETKGLVTLESLFQPVLYEGYAEPQYVWQSSAHASGYEAKYSVLPLLVGTFKAAIYAMVIAIPLALGAAIFVGFFMSPVLRDRIKPTIELLEAFPTVVLGALAAVWLAPRLFELLAPALGALLIAPVGLILVAFAWHRFKRTGRSPNTLTRLPIVLLPLLILLVYLGTLLGSALESLLPTGALVPWLETRFDLRTSQRNALLVGIAMGLAVFPGIFSMAEDAIHAVPRSAAAGSLALGASHWQSYRDVILPVALPGIISAVTLGFGRAMGETMIVLMVAGNTPIMDWNVLEGMRTISASLAIELPESGFESIHYRVLFFAAMLLFGLTFIFNTLAELVRMRMYRRYGGSL